MRKIKHPLLFYCGAFSTDEALKAVHSSPKSAEKGGKCMEKLS